MRSHVDDPESKPRRRFVGEVIVAGSIAGLIGGAVTGLLAILTAAVLGKDGWLPFKLLAGTIYLHTPLFEMHGWAVFWGIVLLFGIAGALGVAFALLLPREGTGVAALFLASAYGCATYVGYIYLGLWSDPLLEHELPHIALFPYILLLCICCGLVPPLRRVIRPLLALTGK